MITKTRLAVFLTFLFLSISCTGNKGDSHLEDDLSLTTFTNVPTELIGCGCALSLTEEDYNNRRYIYADDLDTMAMIVVNRDTVLVNMSPKSKSSYYIDFQKDSVLDVGYESEKITGTLKVRKEGSLIFNEKVIGVCGC